MGSTVKKILPYAAMAAGAYFLGPAMGPAVAGTPGLGAAALQPMAPMLAGPSLAGPGMFSPIAAGMVGGPSTMGYSLPAAESSFLGGLGNVLGGGDISNISSSFIGDVGASSGFAPADIGLGASQVGASPTSLGFSPIESAMVDSGFGQGAPVNFSGSSVTDPLIGGQAMDSSIQAPLSTSGTVPTDASGRITTNIGGEGAGANVGPVSGVNPWAAPYADVSPTSLFPETLGQQVTGPPSLWDKAKFAIKPATDAFKTAMQPIKDLNTGISDATGGFVGLKDIVAGGYALTRKPPEQPNINIDLGQQGGSNVPEATRPDVRTSGITGTTQLPGFAGGNQWNALTDEQKVSNLFTGISSGRGGLTLPGGNPSDPANLQAARQAYMNLATTGGNINPGYANLFGGQAALKKLGKPLQGNTSAGLLSALRELIEQQNA